MGKRAQVLTAIEDFLYEVCLLVVFYPWYLLRLVLRPRTTMEEFRDAAAADRNDELIVSPPLFLFISAAIAVMFLPPVDLGSGRLFGAVAKLFTADATFGKIIAMCMPVLLLAICAALLIEWRTPGGVSRQSFYLPLFMSVLVAAVLLMVMALVNAAIERALADSLSGALISLGGLLVGVGWYLYAQSQVFSLLAGTSRAAGLGYSLAAFFMSEAVGLLLPKG